MTHTLLPWYVCMEPKNEHWYAGITIGSLTGDKRVADTMDGNEGKANAEFIVRAVNAHNDLIAALEKANNAIVELLEVANLRGDNDLPHPADDPKLWTARMADAWGFLEDVTTDIDAALAKAKSVNDKDA